MDDLNELHSIATTWTQTNKQTNKQKYYVSKC